MVSLKWFVYSYVAPYAFPICIIQTAEAEDESDDTEPAKSATGIEAHNVYRRAHLVLFRIIQVVPACPSTLLEILKVHSPFLRDSILFFLTFEHEFSSQPSACLYLLLYNTARGLYHTTFCTGLLYI